MTAFSLDLPSTIKQTGTPAAPQQRTMSETGLIAFNVGGTIVETTHETLAATGSDTLLREAAQAGHTVFIDCDHRHFVPLINFGRARSRGGEAAGIDPDLLGIPRGTSVDALQQLARSFGMHEAAVRYPALPPRRSVPAGNDSSALLHMTSRSVGVPSCLKGEAP